MFIQARYTLAYHFTPSFDEVPSEPKQVHSGDWLTGFQLEG